jgi:hypothetical protein
MAQVRTLRDPTRSVPLYPKAESYYVGAEIPGKLRVFMPYSGGVRAYRRTLEKVATAGYALEEE